MIWFAPLTRLVLSSAAAIAVGSGAVCPRALACALPAGPQSNSAHLAKKQAQAFFAKTFRELQEFGIEVLREHEAGRLTPPHLDKRAKSIHKAAKTLRSMINLGRRQPAQVSESPATPQEFDAAIRRLARLIRSFAHNPVHHNTKVFDTDQAERAGADLAAVIGLSKAIADGAKQYPTPGH